MINDMGWDWERDESTCGEGTNRDITQLEVLKRVMIRLQSKLNLKDHACFIATDWRIVSLHSCPDWFVVVSPLGGSFSGTRGDQWKEMIGEVSGIAVTAFNRLHTLDEGGRDRQLLLDDTSSIMKIKRRILRALVGWNLTNPGEAIPNLNSLVYARSSSPPQIMDAVLDKGHSVCRLTLDFAVEFFWDLSDNDTTLIPEL